MKKISLIYFTIVILRFPSQALSQSLVSYQTVFDGTLKVWARLFHNFKLFDFKQRSSDQFENKNTRRVMSNAAFYPVYLKGLSFSPDRMHVLDIYSYLLLEKRNGRLISAGTDVEQSISLGELPGLQWRQIAYYGYRQRVQDVCWVDNNTFILVATQLNQSGQSVPVVIIGQLKSQSLEVFESSDVPCYQKPGGYTSPKLKALHIQREMP